MPLWASIIIIIIIIIIHPLTVRVVGAPQMTSQPVPSIFHCSPMPSETWQTPGLSHSLTLSSNLFFCLPCFLPPFTVPCKMVLARPDEQDTCLYHCSLHLFTMVRRSSCGLIISWILARTSSLVTWSLHEMCSILLKHLISMACILLWSSAVRVHTPPPKKKIKILPPSFLFFPAGGRGGGGVKGHSLELQHFT